MEITLTQKMLLTFESLQRLLRRNAVANVKKILLKIHPNDIAHIFRYFNEQERDSLFNIVTEDLDKATEILSEVDINEGARLLTKLDKEKAFHILQKLSPDDAADIIGNMPEEVREEMLQLMKKEDSADVEALLSYNKETAGGIMTPYYFALNEMITAKEAIEAIQNAQDAEMVFYLYVVDERNHLVGVISLRQLITIPSDTRLKKIMNTDVISVRAELDQEEVARIVSRYNLLAIPVVDEENKLAGIITVDDVIDVIREEATEDFLKMAGTGDEEIVNRSIFTSIKLRIPWMLITLVGVGGLGAALITRFETVLSSSRILSPKSVVAILAFLPAIMGTGGNVGTQSATIVVRGLATGRINVSQLWDIIFKEIRVGFLLGAIYGILLGALSLLIQNEFTLLGIIVGISVIISMTTAAFIGTFFPMILKRMGIDPAVATGPFVTTSMDILGILVYFITTFIFLSIT